MWFSGIGKQRDNNKVQHNQCDGNQFSLFIYFYLDRLSYRDRPAGQTHDISYINVIKPYLDFYRAELKQNLKTRKGLK